MSDLARRLKKAEVRIRDIESVCGNANDILDALDRIEELESALKRLAEDEANFINAAKWFATRGDYLEADHKERIKYAQESLK